MELICLILVAIAWYSWAGWILWHRPDHGQGKGPVAKQTIFLVWLFSPHLFPPYFFMSVVESFHQD